MPTRADTGIIHFDTSDAAFFRIVYDGVRVTHDQVRDLFSQVTAALAAGQGSVAILTDTRGLGEPLDAVGLGIARAAVDAWAPAVRGRVVANAIIVTDAVVHGGVNAMFWGRDPAVPVRVFATSRPAVQWCRKRLRGGPPRRAEGDGQVGPAVAADSSPALRQQAMVLDLFDRPALILDASSQVAYANRAARRDYGPAPAWVADVLRAKGPLSASAARTLPIETSAGRYFVVVAADPVTMESLPPGLGRVADRLVLGLTDKEIAVDLGLSVATVRTYVRRIYSRLGVHSRTELMKRAR